MRISKENLEGFCASGEYAKGMSLYRNNLTSKLDSRTTPWGTMYVVRVREGMEEAAVQFLVGEDGLTAFCSEDGRMTGEKSLCRHAAAAVISYTESSFNNILEVSPDTNRQAKDILSLFAGMSVPSVQKGTVRLIPRLESLAQDGYPIFSFSIGMERPYVVRDISDLLSHIRRGDTFSYGKNLTLTHSMEMFDSSSTDLVHLLFDQYRIFRTVRANRMDREVDSSSDQFPTRGSIIFRGRAFDTFFQIVADRKEPVPSKNRYARGVEFRTGNPEVSFRLVHLKESKKVLLLANAENENAVFFGHHENLYCLTDDALLQCTQPFRQKIYPLIQMLSEQTSAAIAEADMPAFTSMVLQPLQHLVQIQDEEALLDTYLPDTCTPRFRFDFEGGNTLVLQVRFLYGSEEISSGTPHYSTPNIRRDLVREREALELAGQLLTPSVQDFITSDLDQIGWLIGSGFEPFRKLGEIMVSERLRNLRVSPSRASVGISIQNGSLLLSIDTGEFPPEELEELYQSLLLKRRYYHLKDGRILGLDGNALETLAEMSHMLRLTPKDLEKGQVRVPAFRALYLDSVCSNAEQLNVTRSREFRRMIRNFRSVEESDYAVPEELDSVMRPYQKVGFQWMKTLESCGFGGILADEMGLGKTVEAIAFLCTATRETTGKTSLVVCPASLILNWLDEFQRFAPQLKVQGIMGVASERRRRMESQEMDVWVTSYELLRQDTELYARLSFYACILDEGQHVKNKSTLASRAVKQVDCQQRFVLTGTPIENRLSELWNLFDFLMPGYLYSHTIFVNQLEKPAVKSEDPKAMEQLRRLVQPFLLRRLKKDVLKELPPLEERTLRVPLSEEARKVYQATAKDAIENLSLEGNKFQVLAALTRLRQICCDPHLCFENYEGQSDKLDACLDLCSGMTANGHQILLFSQFTTMLDRIRARLDEMKISNFTLQGSTTKEMRAQLVRRFNDGEASVFLISLKAGGTGLNLTAADVVIHYDPWWNTAAQDQATGRAHRIGQEEHVQVYRLIAQNTIEEKILDLQKKKAGLLDAITDGTDKGILAMSKEDLLALLE